jgi:two-component system CheB/CheR fusion protein
MEEPEDWDEARTCEAILALVRERLGVDFRDQRAEVVLRGISRRLAALSLLSGPAPGAAYLSRLRSDDGEVSRLAEALVVPVSAFFRDPEVWRSLETVVLPDQASLERGNLLRVWAAGIATGEEAWTLAMLLSALREAHPTSRVELLATDVDERSLAHAQKGHYPAAVAQVVPPQFQRFLLPNPGGGVAVSGQLRPLLTFARHDLMGPTLAPPEAIIASFSLVVARNILLYFDERLRTKALARLHGVIRSGGALVLGSVETMPAELASKFRPYPGLPETLHVFRRED